MKRNQPKPRVRRPKRRLTDEYEDEEIESLVGPPPNETEQKKG